MASKANAAKAAMAQAQKNSSKKFDDVPSHVRDAEVKHKQAVRRLEDIKKETKGMEKEQADLETESYVKARFLSDSFGRDPNMIKEYGIRLKEIQRRQREIVVNLDNLKEEKQKISK